MLDPGVTKAVEVLVKATELVAECAVEPPEADAPVSDATVED